MIARELLNHDPTVDKEGNDVSQHVTEAIETLREDPHVGGVACDYYRTGRLQVYFPEKYVQGETIRRARTVGYELDHASNRPGEAVPFPSWDTIGYAELTPIENNPNSRGE